MSKITDLPHASLSTSYQVDDSFDSEKFIKMRLRVCHDGKNPNNSSFVVDDMSKAEDSVKNIPILANVIYDENDQPNFGGHDMEIEKHKMNEDEYKIIYKETPIGVVPEDCNYTIEEYNGKNYVFCDAYIWRNYSVYAEDIIERDKDVKLSMEIIVDAYSYDSKDNVFNITDFRFSGITFLNNDYGTGMENALATTGTFSDDSCKKQFIMIIEELKHTLTDYSIDNSKERGNGLVGKKLELLAKYNLTVEQLDFSIDELDIDELESKIKEYNETLEAKEKDKPNVEFSATYRQRREALDNALDPKIERDADGNLIYEEYYWIADFDDEYVYVERSVWTADDYNRDYGRYTYTFDDEKLTATITSDFEEMVLIWLTVEENQKLQEDRANYEKLQGDFEDYKNNYSTPNTDVEELTNFKETALKEQREADEAAIFSQFDSLKGIVEYDELKDDASKYSTKELEEKCFAILGKKQAKFSIKTKPIVKVNVKKITDQGYQPYGDLFDKYTENEE